MNKKNWLVVLIIVLIVAFGIYFYQVNFGPLVLVEQGDSLCDPNHEESSEGPNMCTACSDESECRNCMREARKNCKKRVDEGYEECKKNCPKEPSENLACVLGCSFDAIEKRLDCDLNNPGGDCLPDPKDGLEQFDSINS